VRLYKVKTNYKVKFASTKLVLDKFSVTSMDLSKSKNTTRLKLSARDLIEASSSLY
jgi:hypothetical protein